jgi:Orsellinic acid/F9775 biosynthesis cluster protein D
MINHSDYFIYLEDWKVLVCRPCKYGLPKKGVERHLRNKHQAIPLTIRQALIVYARSLLLLPPSEIQTPRQGISIPAFDCLELHEDGCYCTLCDAIYGTEGSMIIHCQEHNWVKSQGNLNYF